MTTLFLRLPRGLRLPPSPVGRYDRGLTLYEYKARMTETETSILLESNLPGVELIARGKVRDVYQAGENILFIASDRISAFDVVLPNGIPRKGEVLTKLSIYWFDFLKDVIPTHFITANVDEYPEELHQFRDQLECRSMLVKKLEMFPIECVARGYLAGSGWKEYQAHGTVCGIKLQPGLRSNALLPEPIFTPATKAEEGHDENISFEQARGIVGTELCEKLRDLTLDIYSRAQQHALACGLVLADTKFEFGLLDGEVVLGDEVLTPDLLAVLAARNLPARPRPALLRQAVRSRLSGIGQVQQTAARSGIAARGRGPILPRSIKRPISQLREKSSRIPCRKSDDAKEGRSRRVSLVAGSENVNFLSGRGHNGADFRGRDAPFH